MQTFMTQLYRGGEYLAGAAICAMVVHIGLDVVALAIFERPLRGTTEVVSGLYMPFAVFGALAAVQRARAEIRVDVINNLLSDAAQRRLDAVVQIAVALVAIALAWQTFDLAVRAYDLGEHIMIGIHKIPVWPGKAVIPISFALLAVASLHRAVRP
ncbi:TRAP transporter small permease [Amorphus sp. 3PC139-8]|uniref:TRAP transporter small permease n=1 Tax=Amorphus sp. 3PC139-8 TaxID=2735676 RepID=UPI00345D6A95